MGSSSFRIAAHGLTDVGQRRDQNEDALLVDAPLGLFIVADGMGGHAGGGTASRLAVETIRAEIARAKREEAALFGTGSEGEENPVSDLLSQAVESACRTIYEKAQADAELAGMGTTVTAVLIDGRAAFVAHVGDSRAYLCRGDQIYQVTQDHSLVAEQLRNGAISADEARTSRFKNIITRSVGFEREVLVDLFWLELEAGDVIVACCDGLSNLVEDREILAIAGGAQEQAAERLVDLANSRGGDDNITVAVIELHDAPGGEVAGNPTPKG
jgi:protein phosphatase